MKEELIIMTMILIIVVLVVMGLKPLIFATRDFNITLNDGIKMLSDLKEQEVIKISENNETIVYVTKSEDYKYWLERIIEDINGEYIEQHGSYISFKNQWGEVKEIGWTHTKYYNKFVVYE